MYYVSKGLVGWVQKMLGFANIQYINHTYKVVWVGGSEKVQKPAYVINEWSLLKFRLFNVTLKTIPILLF